MTRKSKRGIERQLDELRESPGGYPTVDLALYIASEWEVVSEEHNLRRQESTGKMYHFPPLDLEEEL